MNDNEDDNDLWAYVTKSIEPLEGREPPVVPVKKSSAKAKKSVMHDPVVIPQALPKDSQEASVGLDRRTAEKLRRGQMPIDGRIDLHGHSRDQAHEALKRFLLASQVAGKRCILVITGKGMTVESSLSKGVLRESLPQWMKEEPFRSIVLAHAQSQPQHGGEGAFYVLLRRKKS